MLFAEEQRGRRDWINFRELADWCARRGNPFVPDEAARNGAYDLLRDDLLIGEFEEGGKSQVLFLDPTKTVPMTTAKIPGQARRMTRETLLYAIQMYSPEILRAEYLTGCWIPHRMLDRWLAKHQLPASPSLFEPMQKVRVSTIVAHETNAIKALAAYLKLKQNKHITRDDAAEWCDQQGFTLSQRGFRFRIWTQARREAGLPELAAPGRKPKSVR